MAVDYNQDRAPGKFGGTEARLNGDVMALALDQARAAAARGEVPVGAVLLAPDGGVLAAAGNQTEADCDASAHAELLVLRVAARAMGSARLPGCTLVVTLEPCPMCAAACVHFRVARVVFGAYDPKGGGIEHGPRVFDAGRLHRPAVVGGVQETACAALLREFFQARR